MGTLKRETLSVFFLFFLMILSGTLSAAREEYVKEYHHEFSTKGATLLNVINRYGRVTITTEPGISNITVDVEVRLDARNESKAQSKLESIQIDFGKTGNELYAKTDIGDGYFNQLEINYQVKMPRELALEIENKFGDVVLNELNAPLNLKVAYGNVKIGKLPHTENKLKISYGKLILSESNYLDLTLRYGEFSINKIKWLKLDSQYSEIEIKRVGLMELESAYDEVEIEAVAELKTEMRFTEVAINTLTQKMTTNTQYGELEIDFIAKTLEEIKIDGAFTDVSLAFESGSNIKLETSLSYADIDLPSAANVLYEKESFTSKTVKASFKSEGEKASVVTINSRYGDVEIDIVD